MAVTQYTGARYVPLFADPAQWDKAKTYEPLTIVLNAGNSYTSKQFVPAGIEITNADYWAQTGNYNAQVEQYRQEVQAFDARITRAQTDATGAAAAVAEEKTAREQADATLTQAVAGKAPTMHADASTTYGQGTDSLYGHVKLSDEASQSAAAAGVAATPKAVADEAGARADALAEAEKLENFRNQQIYFLTHCRSLWYLDYNTDVVDGLGSDYMTLQKYHGTGEYRINGRFKVLSDTSGNTVFCTTAPQGSKWYSYAGLATFYKGTYDPFPRNLEFGESSAPNVIQIPMSTKADDEVFVNGTQHVMNNGGDYSPFTVPTEALCRSAADWVKSQQGTFTYAQDTYDRTRAEKKRTDCSGIIYLGFKQSGKDWMPNTSTSQAAFGKIVACAYPGEDLDMSQCRKGDIFVLINDVNGNNSGHVAIFTSDDGEVYEMNTVYSNGQTLGPQPVGTDKLDGDWKQYARYVVRWWEADFDRQPSTLAARSGVFGGDIETEQV